MIGFCRNCNHFAFQLNSKRLCRHCQHRSEIKRAAVLSQNPESIDRGFGIASDGPDLSKKDFYEDGASGGGGSSRDFSPDDSRSDASSSDDSTGSSGGDDSGSDSASDSGGSDD